MQEKFCLAWLVGCWPLGDWIPERTTLAAGLFMWLLSILITASQGSNPPKSIGPSILYRWLLGYVMLILEPDGAMM